MRCLRRTHTHAETSLAVPLTSRCMELRFVQGGGGVGVGRAMWQEPQEVEMCRSKWKHDNHSELHVWMAPPVLEGNKCKVIAGKKPRRIPCPPCRAPENPLSHPTQTSKNPLRSKFRRDSATLGGLCPSNGDPPERHRWTSG